MFAWVVVAGLCWSRMVAVNLHPLPHMARSARFKRRPRGSERWRQMIILALMSAVLAAGLFAKNEIEITQSKARPVIAPNDDEIYTGSILFVPYDGRICRQVLFDNRTGRLNDNGFIHARAPLSRASGVS